MPPEKLLAALKEKPFRPFRVALTDGRTFDIHHPGMVMPGRRSAVIGIPAPGETETYYDHTVTVDLLHIVSLEPVAKSPNPQG